MIERYIDIDFVLRSNAFNELFDFGITRSRSKQRRNLLLIVPPVHARIPFIAECPLCREAQRHRFSNIRTLVKYGMTVAQVAKVYGVAADEIARILRPA